jgi:TP901 family phage tail tape measure protein
MANQGPNINIGATDSASVVIKRLESNIIRFVGSVSASLAALSFGTSFIREASQFEAEMKNVQKTTDFVQEDIDKLSEAFLDMAKDVGVAAAGLANIGSIAGQLGLGSAGQDAIQSFVKSTAIAQNTLDLTSEAAAQAGAEISQIFTLPIDQVEKLFSTINEVSNQSVASAANIIDIVKRVGNAAGAAFPAVAALAGAAKDLGIPDEQAGTFLVKALGNMLAEAKKFAAAMNVTTESWVGTVKRDPIEAFKLVLTRLSQMQGGVREELTKQLFGSGRLFSAADKFINDASNGFLILNKNIDASTEAYADGQSSLREYAIVMDAFGKQVDKLSATFNSLAIETGNEVLPALTDIVKILSGGLSGTEASSVFRDLGGSLRELALTLKDGIAVLHEYETTIKNVGQALLLFVGFKVAGFAVSTLAGLIGRAAGAVSGLLTLLVRLNTALITVGLAANPLRTLWGFIFATNAGSRLQPLVTLLQSIANGFSAVWAAALRFAAAASHAFTWILITYRRLGFLEALTTTVFLLIETIGRLIAVSARFLVTNPIALALVIASGLLFKFRDEVASFLGFTTEAAEDLRKQSEQAAATADKARQEAVNRFEEARKSIEARTKARQEAVQATIDVQPAAESIRNLEDAFASSIKEVNDLQTALDTAQDKLDTFFNANRKIDVDLNFNDQQQAQVRARINELRKESLTVGAGDPEALAAIVREMEQQQTALLALKRDNAALKREQHGNAEAAAEHNRQVEEWRRSLVEIQGILAKMPDGSKFLSLSGLILDTKRAESGLQAARERLTELQKQREELNKKRQAQEPLAPSAIDDSDKALTEQLRLIGELEKRIEGYNAEIREKSRQDAASASAVKALQSATTEQVAGFVKGTQAVKGMTTTTATFSSELKRNAEGIVRSYVAARTFSDALTQASAKAQFLKKHLQGAFDNVAQEILAIENKVKELTLSFGRMTQAAAQRVRDKNATTDIDNTLRKQKQAIDQQVQWMEQSGQFTQAYIDQARERAEAEVEFQATARKEQIANQAALEEFNQSLADVQANLKKAETARQAGDLIAAEVLVDQAKAQFDNAAAKYQDITELTKTIDAAGHVEQAFPPQLREQLLRQLTEAKQAMVEAIPDIRRSLLDDATAASERLDAAAALWSTRLQAAASVLAQLSAVDSERTAQLVASLTEQVKLLAAAQALAQSVQAPTLSDQDFAQTMDHIGELQKILQGENRIPIRLQSISPEDAARVREEANRIIEAGGGASIPLNVDSDKLPAQAKQTAADFDAQLRNHDVSLQIRADTTRLVAGVSGAKAQLESENPIPIQTQADQPSLDATRRHIREQVGSFTKVENGVEVRVPIYADGNTLTLKESAEQQIAATEPAIAPAKVGVVFDKSGKSLSVDDLKDSVREAETQAPPARVGVVFDRSGKSLSVELTDRVDEAVEAANRSAPAILPEVDTATAVTEGQRIGAVIAEEAGKSPIEPKFESFSAFLEKTVTDSILQGAAAASAAGLDVSLLGRFTESQLQQMLDTMDLRVTIRGTIEAQGNASPAGYATGGYVSGPGSSTSDSILSWLSNGEYVMDALTTSFFGSAFFANLQALARRGKRGLPAFASGGPVSHLPVLPRFSELAAASAPVERVELTIKTPRGDSRVYADRENVQKLVDCLGGLR